MREAVRCIETTELHENRKLLETRGLDTTLAIARVYSTTDE